MGKFRRKFTKRSVGRLTGDVIGVLVGVAFTIHVEGYLSLGVMTLALFYVGMSLYLLLSGSKLMHAEVK